MKRALTIANYELKQQRRSLAWIIFMIGAAFFGRMSPGTRVA